MIDATHRSEARHVAIISDGSRRWARSRELSVRDGHAAAAATVTARALDAVEMGIEELTVYAFSTENWARSPTEIEALVEVIAAQLAADTETLHAHGVRIRWLGTQEGVPDVLVRQLRSSETTTEGNRRMTLFIAFNYGGRAEILNAAIRFEGTTEEEFRRCLHLPEMHDPELVIRTGREQRLSNYLLWQAAYSELVFRQELWPDFTREAFMHALDEYTDRQRRFGGR
ncbi:MAG TPA: polyprenyl diphosphate synthase [Solirubrobacteraceae bacterium]|nr:polyprenyl diphosphate synthase [Solirubrobacteraceae bacterium]